jgi:condensation enzyme
MYTMPADRPHGSDSWTSSSAIRGFSIDSGDFAKVVASAAQNRCTVWHLFLTAIMVLADKVSGLSDITLLTVDNGRTIKDFQNTIGFFANLVPLRLEFGECESFLDLMLLARKASMEAHRNQISFKTILELAPALMSSFDDPLALPPGFNYLKSTVPLADLQFADSVEPVFLPEDVPSMYHRGACMWSFVLLPSGAFRCVIEYEPDMVDADTIDHWGSDFISLLLAIADRPDQAWKNR